MRRGHESGFEAKDRARTPSASKGHAFLICAALLFACGDDTSASSVQATPAAAPSRVEEPEGTDPNPAAQEVDLLRTVRARVTTSSANNEDPRQTWSLTDGDLQTAWNSAPAGDDGERITIQLPEQVTVSAIALTAGYTSTRDSLDLFTANRRIQAVRIRHGEDVFEARLDITDRSLQRVGVHGGGGTWTIELSEWVEGSRNWQELVVSELQVLGIADDDAPPYEAHPEPAPPREHMLTSKAAIRRALVASSTSLETLRSLMDLESTGFMFSLNYEHGIGARVVCTDAHFEADLILPADFDVEEHWSPVLPANIPPGTLTCLPDLSMCMTNGQPGGKEYAFEFRVNSGGRRHLAVIVIPPGGYTLGEWSFLPDTPTCLPEN